MSASSSSGAPAWLRPTPGALTAQLDRAAKRLERWPAGETIPGNFRLKAEYYPFYVAAWAERTGRPGLAARLLGRTVVGDSDAQEWARLGPRDRAIVAYAGQLQASRQLREMWERFKAAPQEFRDRLARAWEAQLAPLRRQLGWRDGVLVTGPPWMTTALQAQQAQQAIDEKPDWRRWALIGGGGLALALMLGGSRR